MEYNYNYQLQSEVIKRLDQIRDDSNLTHYVFKFKNFNHIKTFRFRMRQSLNAIRNNFGITNKEFKYVGVIETSSLFTKKESLFEADIHDTGLHIHLVVSSPKDITHKCIRDYIVSELTRLIVSKDSSIDLLYGREEIYIYDKDGYDKYITKQFNMDRTMEFVVTNLKS